MIKSNFLLFSVLYLITLGCKDNSKSNTGATEYDKLMNKDDIVLQEIEVQASDSESNTSKKPRGKSETTFESDVQFINGTPIYNLSSNYNKEEHDRFLAATKLCWDFDYKEVLGTTRNGNYKNGKDHIRINSCCASFVPSPYISPFEYYYSLYHDNRDITTYKGNVFKLQEIRENLLKTNFESFKNLIQEVETENLVSYTVVRGSIQNYDMDKGQLEVRYHVNKSLRIGNSGSAKVATSGNRYRYSTTHYIPMSKDQAKEIYEHYADINVYGKNPPFTLTTKTTYAMAIPKMEKRPYNFEVRLRKIEFFKTGDGYPEPTDLIGEIKFIEQPDT